MYKHQKCAAASKYGRRQPHQISSAKIEDWGWGNDISYIFVCVHHKFTVLTEKAELFQKESAITNGMYLKIGRLIDNLNRIWCHRLYYELSKKIKMYGSFGLRLFAVCKSKLYKKAVIQRWGSGNYFGPDSKHASDLAHFRCKKSNQSPLTSHTYCLKGTVSKTFCLIL